jgi:hypothetical protein
MVVLAASAACLAIGAGVGIASSGGSTRDEAVGSFNFRTQATSPRPELRDVLSKDGLILKAACQQASGLPVLELALSTRVPAAFGIHYGLQDDETPTQVFHQISPSQVVGLLGPIGKGNGATGTLTYLRPDGDAVTVNFVAMTKASGADCAVGGTVVHKSP